ncbi:MAG: hypothetical protein Q9197_004022 [Variospora fuerteventurae]
MASSFKHDSRMRPSRYRTPSPPRNAYEHLSPPTWSFSDLETPAQQRPAFDQLSNASTLSVFNYAGINPAPRRQSYPSSDAMDTFASIALSTTAGCSPHNNGIFPTASSSQHSRTFSENNERPAKRARSERVPAPEWARMYSNAAARPATSYETVSCSRRMEAELLLNFSQEARLSTPSTMTPYKSVVVDRSCPKPVPRQADPSSAKLSNQNEQKWPTPLGIESQMGRKEDVMAHESSELSMNMPSIVSQATTAGKSPTSKLPPLDFREQLIEASTSAQPQINPFDSAEDQQSTLMLQRTQQWQEEAQRTIEETHVPGVLAPQNQVASGAQCRGWPVDAAARVLAVNAFHFPEMHDGGDQRIPINHEPKMPLNGYWPSMLATTVENSASAWKNQISRALKGSGLKSQQKNSGTRDQSGSALTSVKTAQAQEPARCAACKFTRNSMIGEADGESASWISCDGCKSWFHFACAGFKNEREVRAVDKYRCKNCKAIHGPTTYVRKSTRAHTAIDYAGLNQGVVKTSDERPEHHYIKPIKEGSINLQPENFARMRPGLVTAEFFETGNGMKEPVIVPAILNPRPPPAGAFGSSSGTSYPNEGDAALPEDWFNQDPESRNVLDHGQDALDMVIPPNLTVRKVAELYGPEEKVEVIDVKSQNGEGKKWNMRRWAEYYESTTNKVVRNVISLEVSQSSLGRLIRRPQVVRDLDLQDSVWPAELQAKGEFPRVQFYCLMSVADCFTDFHIDFGGSSVFYHILKGKKTFFFIPPKEKHLKKYEEWCMSPAQNWTFLADQTKECYRVDLSEGDTMLIPAGWIHAVWTPEDSLVIGGNFLTRLNYSMQLRITQIEKATGVARKFRYPHFQKIQWYTAIRYLESDPTPSNVRSELRDGGIFHRQHPAYHDFNAWGENSRSGPENYHARYYSQPELEGLPDLVRYLLRTALIDSGDIVEGITAEARNAVKKSIPRGFGEPLEIVKNFAVWSAWKRGNESIPHWAYPDPVPEIRATDSATRLSATALKKLDRESDLQAPRRQSSRNQVQQPIDSAKGGETMPALHAYSASEVLLDSLQSSNGPDASPLNQLSVPSQMSPSGGQYQRKPRKRKTAAGEVPTSHRKTACESCRRRRRACKHKPEQQPRSQATLYFGSNSGDSQQGFTAQPACTANALAEVCTDQKVQGELLLSDRSHEPEKHRQIFPIVEDKENSSNPQRSVEAIVGNGDANGDVHGSLHDVNNNAGLNRARNEQATPKYSKRRCTHDENGNVDPVKLRESVNPRSASTNKRRKLEHYTQDTVVAEYLHEACGPDNTIPVDDPSRPDAIPTHASPPQRGPAAVMVTPLHVTTHDQPASSTHVNPSQATSPVNNAAEPTEPLHLSGNVLAEPKNTTPPSARDDEMSDVEFHARLPAEIRGLEKMQEAATTSPKGSPFDMPAMPLQLEVGSSFDQPAASSLVSPPASSHDDSEQPVPSTDHEKPTYSGSSSRYSPRHPAQIQRYTPESGPARRDSSSSMVIDNTSHAEDQSLSTYPTTAPVPPDSAQKRIAKARLSAEVEADEESLKLIKALQAEDYGLRRRARVP